MNYYQVIHIESKTMVYMLRKQILPAVFAYQAQLADIMQSKQAVGVSVAMEQKMMQKINAPLETLDTLLEQLEEINAKDVNEAKAASTFAATEILPLMETIRQLTDTIESNMPKKAWPMPDYNDILFQSFD